MHTNNNNSDVQNENSNYDGVHNKIINNNVYYTIIVLIRTMLIITLIITMFIITITDTKFITTLIIVLIETIIAYKGNIHNNNNNYDNYKINNY